MIQNISLDVETLHTEVYSNLKRQVGRLNENDVRVRKQAIAQIYGIVTSEKLSPIEFQQITQQFLKQLLKGFADQAEQVRQTSLKIVIELFTRCEEIRQFLPYVMAVLVERTNCTDLEGIASLPQVMRPPPNQKPKVLIRLQQQSQEVRMLFCQLIQKIIGMTEPQAVRENLDDLINITRTLVIDPCGDIQKVACDTLKILCKTYKNLLLHYTQTICKALLLPIISKKSKIRIAALEALNAALECGLWKFNAFVFEDLIGFRDPNSVPIKDFYNPSININYLATLIVDPNIRVRQAFMKSLHFWVCVLEDKYDHHGKLVPYVLSGLFDEDAEVRKIAFETIEQIGRQLETEKEKQFREAKQYAIDASWTYDGKLVNLPIMDPFVQRPRLGSRFFIRGHVRKMWSAIFREIQDINIPNRLRAAKLALMGVIYTENYMTSHLDKFLPPFIIALSASSKEQDDIANVVSRIFYFIGRYCEYSTYIHIIKSALRGEFVQNTDFIKNTFKALALLTDGNLQCIPNGEGLGNKKNNVFDLLNMLAEFDLFNEVSTNNANEVEQFAKSLINGLQKSAKEEEINEIYESYFAQIVKFLFVLYYEKYLAKDLVMSNKQTHVKVSADQFILDFLNQNTKKYSISELLKDMISSPPSFADANWKFLIGYYIYVVQSKLTGQTVDNVVEILGETIRYSKLPELADGTIKILISLMKEEGTLNTSGVLLQACAQNLLSFRPLKKIPKYLEGAKKNELAGEETGLPDNIYELVFFHLGEALEFYFLKKIDSSLSRSAQILSAFLETAQRAVKYKTIQEKALKVIWVYLQKLNDTAFKAEEFKTEKGPTLPEIIDFLVSKIQTIESGTQYSNLALGALTRSVELFPICPTAATQLPNHYLNYPTLLEKLFKYALDEKDPDTRNRYHTLLLTFCRRMPGWFNLEMEDAHAKGRHERQKMLQNILDYYHK